MKCPSCDFFKEDKCMKADTCLSLIDDPICLARLQIVLLRDIILVLKQEYYDEDIEDSTD